MSSLRPFRHRSFAIIFGAGVVSTIGTWMQTVAVGSLVAATTGSAAWAGLAAAATFLPIGLLSPVGGALADRIDRRRFLIGSNLVDAALATFLAWLAATGRASPIVVTLVTFGEGCVSALRIPFYQAMLPDLVPKDDLLPAVSLNSTQYNLGRIVGPGLAGVVIATWSFTAAFAINAVSFFGVIIALLFIRLAPLPPRPDARLLADIRAGARAAWREPGCRSAIALIGAAALLVAPFIALIPAVASNLVGDVGSADATRKAVASLTGTLTAAQGAGAVVGALLLTPIADRFGRRRTMQASLFVVPFALGAYAAAPSRLVAAVTLAVLGAVYITILSGLSAVVQLRAPEEYRGRILSLYVLALGGVYPIGAILQGVIADQVGLAETMAGGALMFLVLMVVLRSTTPLLLATLGPEDTADAPPDDLRDEAPAPA